MFGSCSGKARVKYWRFPQSCLWNQKLGQAVLCLGLHGLKSKAVVSNLCFFQSLTYFRHKPSRMFLTFFPKGCFPSMFMQWGILLAILSIHYWPNNTRHSSHWFSWYPFSASEGVYKLGWRKPCTGLPNSYRDFPFQDIMMRCWDFTICFLYFTELLKVLCFFTSYIWSACWTFHRVKALEGESCISFGGKSSFSCGDWSCQTPRHVKLHLGNHKCCW